MQTASLSNGRITQTPNIKLTRIDGTAAPVELNMDGIGYKLTDTYLIVLKNVSSQEIERMGRLIRELGEKAVYVSLSDDQSIEMYRMEVEDTCPTS